MVVRSTNSLATYAVLVLLYAGIGSFAWSQAVPEHGGSTQGPAEIERLGSEAAQALLQIYDNDRTIPLETRIVERVEKDATVREKIVFRGAQGFLVPGYLQYPVGKAGPFPCVLLLHGWSGSKDHWWVDGNYISGGNVRRALLETGHAILRARRTMSR